MLWALSTSSNPAQHWHLLPADAFTTVMQWAGGESRRMQLVRGHGRAWASARHGLHVDREAKLASAILPACSCASMEVSTGVCMSALLLSGTFTAAFGGLILPGAQNF